MNFQKSFLLIVLCAVFTNATAQKYVTKSEAEVKTKWNEVTFSSNKTLTENISDLGTFSYLNGIFDDENLKNQMLEQEMITVFAPIDNSFNSLSEEDRESLLADSPKMSNVIKFLVVPGRLDLASIRDAIRLNDGYAFFATLSGARLGAKLVDNEVVLFDSENNIAPLTATDFYHKNGLFHMIDGLVYPSSDK